MKIKVGKVLKAQGIKGEVKVSCLLDDAALLKRVKQMYLGNNLHKVEKIRCDGNVFYVLFDTVKDRNAAENLRDWEIFCDKEDLVLEAGRYFIDDIVGCIVKLDDGETVGEVKEILQYGAADVYVCDGPKGTVSFPFLKDLIVSVDVDVKSIVLGAKRFAEVACYDDED